MRRFYYNQQYIWFHVLEDEISHRGQIKMLKSELFENYVKYKWLFNEIFHIMRVIKIRSG